MKDIHKVAMKYHAVGSNYIIGEEKTDIDTLFLIHPFDMHFVEESLSKAKFICESESDYPSYNFKSWRKGKENYIICWEDIFYENFVKAADICKFFKVEDKETRIKIHQNLLYGKDLFGDFIKMLPPLKSF